MANVYKNIQATISSAGSDVSMYTSPTATTSIRLFNTHGSALTVTTKVRDSSASTDFEFSTNTVNASDSADMLTFNNILILEEGDILKMQVATTNVIKMTASVLQITRT